MSNRRYYEKVFTNTGSLLPEGTYTTVYVKDETAQFLFLNCSTSDKLLSWSTSNAIINDL